MHLFFKVEFDKTVVILSNTDDVKIRTLKIFGKHTKNMIAITEKI